MREEGGEIVLDMYKVHACRQGCQSSRLIHGLKRSGQILKVPPPLTVPLPLPPVTVLTTFF